MTHRSQASSLTTSPTFMKQIFTQLNWRSKFWGCLILQSLSLLVISDITSAWHQRFWWFYVVVTPFVTQLQTAQSSVNSQCEPFWHRLRCIPPAAIGMVRAILAAGAKVDLVDSDGSGCWFWIFWKYGYGSKLGTPKLWMVNTKLHIHICGPINGLPFWPTSI